MTTPPPSVQRKIIHIDMDCFYAAVEMWEDPSLRGKPIAVGGNPQARGVVATCSYEARRFGIHSAMAMSAALRLCPELVVLPVRMALYQSVSREIRDIFHTITDLVEPLSLDEAFLDVTHSGHCQGSATRIASQIRQQIEHRTRLTASAGIAPNKFLAKVASDWHKPNGQKVITPQQIEAFVHHLPVKKIFGVGKVTEKKMAALGIDTCGDLQTHSMAELIQHFGSFGPRLYELSRGIDERPVTTHRIRKSLSIEDTFPCDLPTLAQCQRKIPQLYQQLIKRLAQAQQQQRLIPKTLSLKMRFNDFTTTTAQRPADRLEQHIYQHLCQEAWQRGQRPVRLLGLGIQFHPPDQPEQLRLHFGGSR